eukprot:4373182-Pyramimonas_sp.AAC.1
MRGPGRWAVGARGCQPVEQTKPPGSWTALLGNVFGVRKYLKGELNPSVVEWLNKGLTAASSPSERSATSH